MAVDCPLGRDEKREHQRLAADVIPATPKIDGLGSTTAPSLGGAFLCAIFRINGRFDILRSMIKSLISPASLALIAVACAIYCHAQAAQRATDVLGSNNQPLVIKVLPSPESSEERKHDDLHAIERAQDRADRAAYRKEQETSDKVSECIGIATVAILVVQAIAFFLQSRQLRRSVVEMRAATRIAESASVSAKAAADAAIEANNLNLKALNAEHRPWLTLQVQINSDFSHDQHGWHFPLEYNLKNIGKTPARRARFSAQVIAYMDGYTRSDGTSTPRTDVSAELRNFAQRAREQAEDPQLLGSLIFPAEKTRQLSYYMTQGDPTFEESLTVPAYTGLLVVLACVTYFSTIDGSLHETVQAFSLGLWNSASKTSSRIELISGEFKMNGRGRVLAQNPWGDDYAT